MKEPSKGAAVPECTCGSPFLMTHAIWCNQYEFWDVTSKPEAERLLTDLEVKP